MLSLVALCGGLTIVGSGFSAWYFQISKLEKSNSISHYVTDLNDSIGTLEDDNKDDKLYIIMDQGSYAKKADPTYGVSINKVTGTVSDSNLGTAVEKLGATYSIKAADATKLVAAGITSGTFKATFTLSKKANAYLTFKNGYENTTTNYVKDDNAEITVVSDTITYTYTVDFTKHTAADYSQDFTFNSSTSTLKDDTDNVIGTGIGLNAMLSYYDQDYAADGNSVAKKQKPQSADAYKTMKENLGTDALMTIAYEFAVTEPTA